MLFVQMRANATSFMSTALRGLGSLLGCQNLLQAQKLVRRLSMR
jgi:hypothetical protein